MRERYCGIGHRNRACADLGVGADFLGDGKRVLKEARQVLTDGTGSLGVAECTF